jgi:hypothetical protein
MTGCASFPLALFSQAGRTSFLDEFHLLFVGHTVNVPQVLSTALGSLFRKMSLGCRGGQG